MKKIWHICLVTSLIFCCLWVVGCGTQSIEKPSDQSNDSEYHATIAHAFGSTEITHKPSRVVTLGQGSAEICLAMDIVPIAMEEYPWGADETGYLPWIYKDVQERNATLPTLIKGGAELDIESIADAQPDLILAPWSGITQEQYDLLSKIAPTVAYPKLPWTITWDQQICMVCQAVGEPNKTEDLIAEVNGLYGEYSHPEYGDVTFSYIYNTGPGSLGVLFPTEQRVSMLTNLGLKPDPVIDSFKEMEVPGTDSALIGLENAEKLKGSTIIFTFYSNEQNRREIESQELYQQIPAISKGAVVAPKDQSLVTASSIVTPLTIRYALPKMIPLIDEAIAASKK